MLDGWLEPRRLAVAANDLGMAVCKGGRAVAAGHWLLFSFLSDSTVGRSMSTHPLAIRSELLEQLNYQFPIRTSGLCNLKLWAHSAAVSKT